MLANRVKETTATTGTGSFTTAGAVAGFQTFNTAFGLNKRFHYWAVNGTNNEWECGVGYLSGTTTLVREAVLDNSSAGTTAINFTTAPSLFVSPSEIGGRFPAALAPTLTTSYELLLSEHLAAYSTSYTARSADLTLQPFICSTQALIDKWAVYVATASAGAVARLGIYLIDETTGLPTGDPWMESDDIDCGSTGYVALSFSNNTVGPTTAQRLPERFFLGLAFEDATIKLMAKDYTRSTKLWLPVNANGAVAQPYQNFTMGTPTPTSSALPTIGTIAYRTENYATAGFAT